ncbi:MAG: lipo-like protein [Proteobacteria bacterium]|nr:lipo-like protein [Pseudomonadota bacterium]
MSKVDLLLAWIGRQISDRVMRSESTSTPIHTSVDRLRRILRPGDVLLVDGSNKVSAAIRYLTQSSWSHVAMYVGDIPGTGDDTGNCHSLIEVELGHGCISSSLTKYERQPSRICRPVNLAEADRLALVHFMIDRIGLQYDLKHIFDLARFLCPHPPVPLQWRRKMLSFGSGDPTRAICSSLIAQAFESIGYPILPDIEKVIRGDVVANGYSADEIFHIRHHSLYTPRDFDISPYFEIVKPTLVDGFNYKGVSWADRQHPRDTPCEARLAGIKRHSAPRGVSALSG